MFSLRCTVRGCVEILELRGTSLRCASGHSFDRAREGYWNLLQPQDRRSVNPGDADESVLARHRWLERGHMGGLVDALRPWLVDDGRRTLDLGCGEGSFAPALFAHGSAGYCGLDLSKRALKLAARRWPSGTWVLVNADRILPAADRSVARIVSWFGRRPVAEIGRVLQPGGDCFVAVPAEDDLIELREGIQRAGVRRSRWRSAADELSGANLELIERREWRESVHLDPPSIRDALTMTYRGARRAERTRAGELPAMDVTLAADLLHLRPRR